jgi:hypothetical protein
VSSIKGPGKSYYAISPSNICSNKIAVAPNVNKPYSTSQLNMAIDSCIFEIQLICPKQISVAPDIIKIYSASQLDVAVGSYIFGIQLISLPLRVCIAPLILLLSSFFMAYQLQSTFNKK